MALFAETETAPRAEIEMAEAAPITSPKSRISLCRQIISPETALHQSALSLADQAVASVTNFLTGIIIARACSKDELGLYMLGYSLVLFVTDMQTSLIATPYMVYAPRLKGHAHALYTGSTLIHQLVFCIVTMLGVLCGAVAVTNGVGPRALGPVLWALILVIALMMLREFARRVCFTRLKLKAAFLLDTCIACGQIGGLLVLAHFGLLSASRAYWVVGLVCGIAVLGWLWSERACYDARMGESLADFNKNWVLGKWVFASGLVWAISMNIYPWLLAAFRDVASTGVWAACFGTVSIGGPAIVGLQNLIGPKIANEYATHGHRALYRLVLRITAGVAALLSLLCLVIFIWGDRLVVLLYGHHYAGNSLVVRVLALNALVTAVTFPFSRALFAIGRARVDFVVNFAALFIMVTVGLWLVRAFGPIGAAFGLLGANLVTSAIRAVVFLRLPVFIPNENTVG